MIEVKKFLGLAKKYWYFLVLVPLLTVIAAYFFVRNVPDEYFSHVRIATGLSNNTDAFIKNETSQEFQINQQFNNLIQLISSRKIIDQVSYKLIIHDLTTTPYLKPSKQLSELSPAERQQIIRICTDKLNKKDELNLFDPVQKSINKVMASMKYDYESILSTINVFRINFGDFIEIDYTSSNPDLSAFIVNNVANEFITYYKQTSNENSKKAITFLDSLVRQKHADMNEKMESLRNYKIKNNVLNLQEQSKSIYGEIADMEMKRETAKKDIEANTAALKVIEGKFNPTERKYFERALINVNQDIMGIREKLKNANNQYVQSGFDIKYKKIVDSLQDELTTRISRSSDHYIYNPLASKDNLVNQKMTLEVSRDLALNSLSVINSELLRLNQKIQKLVPDEASIQAYEAAIDIASKEYIESLNKFNQTSLVSSLPTKITIIEEGMPGDAKSSKKNLIIVLAGIISFLLCNIVLFILFYFDNTIKDADQLANATQILVLGTISKVPVALTSWKKLWDENDLPPAEKRFKSEIRALRFEIDNDMKNSSILGISSIYSNEGVSFSTLALAYAFNALNKKVLLIDGNFRNHNITTMHPSHLFIEDYLKAVPYNIIPSEGVTVLGNRGGDISLFELGSEEMIKSKMEFLKTMFDIIVIDMSSLENDDNSREWILFTEKMAGVFLANTELSKSKQIGVRYLQKFPDKFVGWIFNNV